MVENKVGGLASSENNLIKIRVFLKNYVRHATPPLSSKLISIEMDALHRAMRPASHCRICMVIKIATILLAFFVVADYLFARKLS
jgi:hypothetical protein